ncbi:uncharacterized protein BCR38DRAFT_350863 [Pseudomassariella vexata]|uniref:Flo11 n=1 Tax=Pseudomassariella vexata TaxID=1141098 RepID=A0A1Y2DK14_9PEZI|nr:uncharacterized protein BCR38DRAFT_350863 [Pseudomassariella vexata]ORY59580.1 hypothetical protein BCR38DRAFT_350863 [Pseudomassariella vexata]
MSNSPISDAGVANTPRLVRSRTTSVSSDRPSTIGQSLMLPPLSVSPEAAFIAASAASQIVTNDHDSHSESWYDQMGFEPSGQTALVSSGALQLANNFIDQILFNIISKARSTTLSALRPAVSEVLKPKLAKDAINQADEELREYLGGGEVENLVQSPIVESSRDWDLELVWKRTRLRCMVYSSLGDMEEEDEDYFMEQEHLSGESEDILSEVVSPAVAIFLTSILEFMGEQILVVSGQAAFNRLRIKYEKELKEGARSKGDFSDRMVVEELDMERVALDRTLGRLWRSWKKRIRSPVEPNFGRNFARGSTHSRCSSFATDVLPSKETFSQPQDAFEEEITEPEEREPTQKGGARPSAIPLPMSNNDIAEIEVPGLVSYSDEEDSEEDEEEDDEPIRRTPRPRSLMVLTSRVKRNRPTPNVSEPQTPTQPSRKRANSLPTPAASPYTSPKGKGSHAEAEPVKLADAQEDDARALDTARAVTVPTPASVSPLTEFESDGTDKASVSQMSAVSKIMAGATAVGNAAVAGVTAIAQGSAPQTKITPLPTPMEEPEKEDLIEEAQIMTSSRVSISGASTPSIEPRRPLSLMPARSNSLRSVRMIDVQPRSPLIRSRTGSFDTDSILASRSNVSREGSISTPPIVEEDGETPFAKAMKLNVGVKSSSRAGSREPSPASIQSLKASSSRSLPPTSAPMSMPAFAPAPAQGPTKVTILNTTSNGSFGTKPEVSPKPSVSSKQPSLPALPERSTSRGVYSPSAPMQGPVGMPLTEESHSAPRASPESPKLARVAQTESPSSTSSMKLKAVRNSEDSGSNRAEDVARNFEQLLQNDQTLQYTLTPENMRDFDHLERSRSSSLKRSMSVSKATGLNSHPPTDYHSGKLSGPVPRAPPVSYSSKTRSGAASQARDARIPRESLQDFAEFIRSTGPSGSGNRALPSGGTHTRNVSVPVPMKSSMDSRSIGSVNRARLQARDAAISSNNESSELIDFIRRGPPSTGNNPRIPRNVAPFRTTMDSDQLHMSGAVGGKAVDATLPDVRSSQASTSVTENSVQSSINSQSALLGKTNKPAQHRNNFDDDDMAPKRKQRRIRDPYAIDFSDEEGDDFEMTPKPKPKPKKEESLIDFLNNYPPPPDPTPPTPVPPASKAFLKKKASAPNLLTRLRSAGSSSNHNSNNGSVRGQSRNGVPANESRSLSSRAGNVRGYTPIVANIPPSAERMPNIGVSNASNTPRASSSGGRVLMRKFEPREPTSAETKTSDLANFLRDSEPPPSAMATMPPPVEEKSSGFSRMFERRRKGSTAY